MRPSKAKATAFDPVGALRKLRKIEAHEAGATGRQPTTLALADMFTCADLMQQREGDRAHVKELRAGLKAHGALDPILVRQVGKKFLIVDGHHRFVAYREAETVGAVPVAHFQGDLREAVKEAIRANAKAKLNMTEEDKLNAAWRMTCMAEEGYSLAEIAKTCDVGTTTVSNMRATMTSLNMDEIAGGPTLDRASKIKTWAEAKKAVKAGQRPLSEAEIMEMAERRVRDFVKRLQKEFGPALKRNATTTAKAFSDHLGGRFKDVSQEMLSILDDSEREEIFEDLYGGDDAGGIIGEQPGEDEKPPQPKRSIMETLEPIPNTKDDEAFKRWREEMGI